MPTGLNSNPFGCPNLTITFTCNGSTTLSFPAQLKTVAGTNYLPRMSTGLELQVLMPVINAPLRVYWAYNPLRLDTEGSAPVPITRSMCPAGTAGDYTYLNAITVFSPHFQLREPRKTFRFSVATTF